MNKLKSIGSSAWGYLSDPGFLVATVAVVALLAPIAIKLFRKVPVVGTVVDKAQG